MKNLLVQVFSLTLLLVIIISCSEDADPQFRIHNELSSKANVQIQTSGGNTININDVQSGNVTSYQTASEGNIIATVVIQNESASPTKTFFASKGNRYTIVILNGITPELRVDRE